jgi:hypothetical protein
MRGKHRAAEAAREDCDHAGEPRFELSVAARPEPKSDVQVRFCIHLRIWRRIDAPSNVPYV